MKWQFEISDLPKNPAFPVIAYQVYDNGIKKGPFNLSIEALLTALSEEPEIQYDPDSERSCEDSSPVLPFGTILYAKNETGSSQRITMEIPQKQWEIRYGTEDESIFTVGFPRMIIQYLVVSSLSSNQTRIDETRIYAVTNNGEPITEETALFAFPYPNVGKSNGIVCWGQNQRLTVTNLVELERMFRWFVSAPFNEDHGTRTTHGIPNFRKLLDEIQDKPFDDNWLIPMNSILRDIITN